MYFKKLSLQGFKSFADPVSIEFDRGITCVVGPNGSGKSNISDALRWVLGEQSPRMLRGGKMDEVIFAGTDTRRMKGMAEVVLVIDNSDHSLPIDFEEVSITRRMYRSGESEYMINGSQCRLRDIRELIMDTGIGVDGYSIIGQGKIAEIISGRPDSRREIFEEAAGIVRYRSKKAEAERKLSETSVNLERINDMLTELGGRIGPLKEEADKAAEYTELSGRLRENEINVILKTIEDTGKKAAIQKNEAESLDGQIAVCENSRRETEEALSAKKRQLNELDDDDMKTREQIMRFNSELDELRNNVKLYNEKINTLKANVRIYKDEMLRINEKMTREEASLKQLRAQSDALTNDSKKVRAEMSDISAQYDKAQADHREKTGMFDADRDRLYDISIEASAKGAEISSLRQIGKTLEERMNVLLENDRRLSAESSYESEYKAALRKSESLKRQMDAENIRLAGFRNELSAASEKCKAAERRYSQALKSLNESTAKKEMLEQLENSYEGYNYAVRFIMNESRIKGIYGTVGELMQVPPGYETAIDTALGARVQNIVCSDNSCAAEAVRMLKARRAGRLTFLPVENLRVPARRPTGGLQDEEGFIGIAADCIKADPAYTKIMEYLLGGTAVVRTLDDAMRISGKYRTGLRYVTLDGEFINPAGAITGGSQKNNSAGILERKNRLHEMEKVVYQLKSDMKSAEAAVKSGTENEAVISRNISDSETRCRALEIDIINASNAAESLKQKADDHHEETERSKKEVERIRAELAENAKVISQLERDKAAADAEADNIRQRAEALVEKNAESQKLLDELSVKLTDVKIRFESVRTDLINTSDLISASEKRLADFREEYAAREAACRDAESGQEALEGMILQSSDAVKLRELAYTSHNEKIESIRQAKLRVNDEIDKLQMDRESTDKQLFVLRTSQHDIMSRIEASASSSEMLKNRLWDEFEISYLQAQELKKVTFDLHEGQKESRRLKIAIRQLGDVNLGAVSEYAQVSERYEFTKAQKKDLDEATAALKKIIEDTDVRIRAAFKSSFDTIGINFNAIFTELFGGGQAELRIDGADDPLTANIDIIVRPPGKKLQNMNLLSGGEKTMTAIALMFAVLKTKPTPFCILDEVEAALDEANIERFADYLDKFQGIQFVLVTHQKVTMEHANVLYGVAMPEKGISTILSLRLSDAADWEGKE